MYVIALLTFRVVGFVFNQKNNKKSLLSGCARAASGLRPCLLFLPERSTHPHPHLSVITHIHKIQNTHIQSVHFLFIVASHLNERKVSDFSVSVTTAVEPERNLLQQRWILPSMKKRLVAFRWMLCRIIWSKWMLLGKRHIAFVMSSWHSLFSVTTYLWCCVKFLVVCDSVWCFKNSLLFV